ncbi:hypothetical protein C8T65DRAFT_828702 [Cerioporus squamosus]|nr:hypothetical protein C8T65DRAFT_828702 [Cerioporus squamosus]
MAAHVSPAWARRVASSLPTSTQPVRNARRQAAAPRRTPRRVQSAARHRPPDVDLQQLSPACPDACTTPASRRRLSRSATHADRRRLLAARPDACRAPHDTDLPTSTSSSSAPHAPTRARHRPPDVDSAGPQRTQTGGGSPPHAPTRAERRTTPTSRRRLSRSATHADRRRLLAARPDACRAPHDTDLPTSTSSSSAPHAPTRARHRPPDVDSAGPQRTQTGGGSSPHAPTRAERRTTPTSRRRPPAAQPRMPAGF